MISHFSILVVQGQPKQKVHETPISTNSWRGVVHTCHPSYAGSISRRNVVQATRDINVRPYLKNNESKKD
jgi:hypothetical protein